jgi:hypothetical protein
MGQVAASLKLKTLNDNPYFILYCLQKLIACWLPDLAASEQ